MSNVIQFLESLGRNPANDLSSADYAAAVAVLEIDDSQRQALLDRDHVALNDLLGGRAKVYCLVAPAENEPQQDDQQESDDDGQEKEEPQDAASLN
jgi:hypothetical protein